MHAAKWGHSLTVRLPAAVVSALGLAVGNEIDITVAGLRDIRVSKKASALDTLEALRRFRGQMRLRRNDRRERVVMRGDHTLFGTYATWLARQ